MSFKPQAAFCRAVEAIKTMSFMEMLGVFMIVGTIIWLDTAYEPW